MEIKRLAYMSVLTAPNTPTRCRHASAAKQSRASAPGLRRRYTPRNDGGRLRYRELPAEAPVERIARKADNAACNR